MRMMGRSTDRARVSFNQSGNKALKLLRSAQMYHLFPNPILLMNQSQPSLFQLPNRLRNADRRRQSQSNKWQTIPKNNSLVSLYRLRRGCPFLFLRFQSVQFMHIACISIKPILHHFQFIKIRCISGKLLFFQPQLPSLALQHPHSLSRSAYKGFPLLHPHRQLRYFLLQSH